MFRLIYMSEAVHQMPDEAVIAIVQKSRRRNEASGLRGALLYHEGRFIHMLEGPEAEVMARFERLRLDPRHHSLQLLGTNGIDAPLCASGMEHHDIDALPQDIAETLHEALALLNDLPPRDFSQPRPGRHQPRPMRQVLPVFSGGLAA